ncbi:hypothetical protein JCM6882_007698 [Rhodosporidiobolus microsporus]
MAHTNYSDDENPFLHGSQMPFNHSSPPGGPFFHPTYGYLPNDPSFLSHDPYSAHTSFLDNSSLQLPIVQAPSATNELSLLDHHHHTPFFAPSPFQHHQQHDLSLRVPFNNGYGQPEWFQPPPPQHNSPRFERPLSEPAQFNQHHLRSPIPNSPRERPDASRHPVPPPQEPVQHQRSCEACRATKMRCEKGPDPHPFPCLPCVKRGIRCVPPKPYRPGPIPPGGPDVDGDGFINTFVSHFRQEKSLSKSARRFVPGVRAGGGVSVLA